VELLHQLREHIRSDGGNCADGELPGNSIFKIIDAPASIADGRQNLPRIVEETSPSLRQDDRSRQTIKQRLSDFRFQLSNLLAE